MAKRSCLIRLLHMGATSKRNGLRVLDSHISMFCGFRSPDLISERKLSISSPQRKGYPGGLVVTGQWQGAS
jgi:hypothetical protein